jgi:hypothetical protein
MKNILVFLAFIAVLTSSKPSNNPETYDLASAVENNLIICTITGNNESTHYYQPLSIDIKNLTDKEIIITIPNGQKFKSEDNQDIVITREEMIAVSGKESTKKPIFGMCIQKYNPAPDGNEIYTIGGLATGNLASLTTEIQKQEAFNTLGQYAIWTLTDDNTLTDIDGFDIKEASYLREYVADLLDLPLPEIVPSNFMPEDSEPTLTKRSVEGKFRYKFSKTSAVTIGMFNDKNIIVKELYNNPTTKPGEHHLSYEFDTMIYPDDVYYIRLIIDGQIKLNMEMKTRRS